MIPGFNKVVLLGRLTRDVTIVPSPLSGKSIARTGLAVNRRRRDDAGQVQEEVTYVELEAYGGVAEHFSRQLAKGWAAFIEGHLRLEEWTDKKSKSIRQALRVIVETFESFGPPGVAADG